MIDSPTPVHPVRAGQLRAALPPVVAWLVSNLVTWLVALASVAGDGSRVAYWSTGARRRWDSEHYLSIARGGYELFRCRDRYPDFPDVVCGNVAWFPGYPMAVRAVSATGLTYELSALLVTEAALLGMFGVLWWLLGARLTRAAGLTLAVGTVFPGGVYFHALFPVALATLALLVCVAGVGRGSWWTATAGGFAAVACHPVGAVAVVMLAASALFAWRGDTWPLRVARAGLSAVVAAGGVLWAKWMMWQATGRWDAYEIIQRSSYGQGDLRRPLAEMVRAYDLPFSYWYTPKGRLPWLVQHALAAHRPQMWLNTAFVVMVLTTAAVLLLRRKGLSVEEWAALVLTVAVFLVPFLAGAQMSWYRNHAQMFVGLLLVRRMSLWVQVPLLVACAVQYALLTAMFFAGVLV
ncbi:hypothetical protein ACFYZT_25095 [Streptomyces sp. NPDC001591]|uniref:hypothetical protein n=1 Tax=Streptomyces sp. NPDC001591 TaxID=3364589 RepID=UPI00369F9CDE